MISSGSPDAGHPAAPPRVSRPWIAVAVATWVVAGLGAPRQAQLPAQPFAGEAIVATDVIDGRFGRLALVQTDLGTLLLDVGGYSGLAPGDVLAVQGRVKGEPGRFLGRSYLAVLDTSAVAVVGQSANAPLLVGNAVRAHVVERLQPYDDGRALLAGFLIGETSGLSDLDVEAMRRSGLAHFVAVSGSNVALVLGLAALVAGPLALGPKRRALVGLAVLPVYAAATRFEPSVMRASVMAAIALAGRLGGVVLEAWQLLSLAVVVLLVSDPGLTASAGFQMSVAATGGVLVGARWPVAGGRAGRAVAVTIGAQLAVAPLLLVHFGSVPLMSPLANLAAAPLVTGSTLLGAVGVLGPGFLVDLAAAMAEAVLWIARGASVWPQAGALTLAVFVALTAAAVRFRRLRVALAVVAAGSVLVALIGPSPGLPADGAVVFDVGQGDSILLHSNGQFALVDGGPDQLVLIDKLRRYGVERLDLVVLTHVHADHAIGLLGLVGRFGIEEVWLNAAPHATSASTSLLESLEGHGIPVRQAEVGMSASLGSLSLSVEGPLRRYGSPNDQSVVVMVEGAVRSMLLSGDIETYAQAELSALRADVLKVPHQGAATSDPKWLAGVGADLAVISVGPNTFGHPADWVIDVLEASGAVVLRTDEEGDIPISLG